MEESITQSSYWLVSGRVLFLFLHLAGLICFAYIVAKRLVPLLRAQRDRRWDKPLVRLGKVFQYWLCQWRHPRYLAAGVIHVLIFAGFLLLVSRAATILALGVSDRFAAPLLTGRAGQMYEITQAYAATVVFLCVVIAAIRRIVFKPARYQLLAGQSKWRAADAIFLLALIGVLMLADGLFEATSHLHRTADSAPALSLAWVFENTLASAPLPLLHNLRLGTYLVHEFTFFFLLCYRPFGIQFHVETSLFTIYFAKLDRGVLKPVRWGISDEALDQLPSFGVKRFEDFTWKHLLDFYSCADCGRCSDQCPAKAAGRVLSPRLLTTKARDYSFRHYPVLGKPEPGQALAGTVYSEDEIWSCTTCGACEAECPLLVEYIDKIVDLRRGLVDDGKAPQSLHKPLKALESRGNPFGKPEKKRADWAQGSVPLLNGAGANDTLYFVDSITSYDDRIQSIGRATARILGNLRMNFGILGAKERDSGHDVRRFGEETLFLALRDHNTEAIRASGVRRIVTADPHAYNALKHDYRDMPPVEHTSQVMARAVRAGQLRLNPVENGVFAYHDPCYLGRHNGIYEDPRDVLDSIPGLRRVEMKRCKDRSFCCGGGGLALFYEAKEEQRMGVMRVRMAAEAGAGTIVTACPYCMVNIEDAIKVAGLEGQMTAIDLAELVDRQMTS
ncbi:MAG TPA: (Fe-S)-binding protein [Candidatus Solibacter sp.]